MEEVNLNAPNRVVESRWQIKPDAIVYCEPCGIRMRVGYSEVYQGELWVCDCGFSTNWVDGGYEHIMVKNA